MPQEPGKSALKKEAPKPAAPSTSTPSEPSTAPKPPPKKNAQSRPSALKSPSAQPSTAPSAVSSSLPSAPSSATQPPKSSKPPPKPSPGRSPTGGGGGGRGKPGMADNFDVRLGEAQILTCSKDSKDRLLMLHDKIKERIDKYFQQMGEAKKEGDRLRCKEMIMLLKMLVGRLQLGIYDSHLMIELCHYLQSYDLALNKCKEEARRLLIENGRIRDQIESLSDQAYAKEAQLASTHEMMAYWEFMAETAAIELTANGEDFTQHELWRGIFKADDHDLREDLYDVQDPERTLYQELRRLLAANEIHNGIRHVKFFLKSGAFRKCPELANILIVTANYCHDAEMYEDALDALTNARIIFSQLQGANCKTAAIITCRMAYIHVSDQAWANGAAVLRMGLQDYCNNKESESTPFMARLFFNMGYFLFKMNQPEKGFRAMELAVVALEKLLPESEEDWLHCCFLLSKLLNASKYYAAACFVTCESFQYLLDNTGGGKNSLPIYDIAVAQDEFGIVCKQEDVPPGFAMSSVYQEILGEMKMAFCGMARVAANDLIEYYIEEVKKHDAEVTLTEDQMRQEMNRIMDKKERTRAPSVIIKVEQHMKSPKTEFRVSQAMITLMHRFVDQTCPLEYKTVEFRGKVCKAPMKNLQTMLKQDIQIDASIKRTKDDQKKLAKEKKKK